MIISLIATSIEFLIVYFISKSLSSYNIKPNFKDIISIIIYNLLMNLPYTDQLLVIWIIGQLSIIIYISFVVSPVFHDGFFLSLTTIIFTIVCQFLSALIISLINKEILDSKYIVIIGNLVCLILSTVIANLSIVRKAYNLILSSFIHKSVLLYSYILMFILLLIYKYNITSLYENLFVIIPTIILLLIANATMLFYEQTINSKNQELVSYQKNLPKYEALISDIRTSQHEFSNRIQSLEALPNSCNTYESLCAAIKKYTYLYEKPQRAYPLLQINLPLLAASLYSLYIRAEEKGIIVQFEIKSPIINSSISETELADFTSILFQNAIEECTNKDYIYIIIDSIDNKMIFEIRNPVSRKYTKSELSSFFNKGTTSKKNRKKDNIEHGLGLHYLNKQLIKLKGNIMVDCIEQMNKTWIIFNMKV